MKHLESRLHGGVGRTATVDFMVIVRSNLGQVLNIIPGEAKVNMQSDFEKYCKQLTKYLWKVATYEDIRTMMMVGILMDHSQFRIAFCPYVFDDGRNVPL